MRAWILSEPEGGNRSGFKGQYLFDVADGENDTVFIMKLAFITKPGGSWVEAS